jgi:hypothetical protein
VIGQNVTLSSNASHSVISKSLTAAASKVTIFWHTAPCNFLLIYRRSGVAHCSILKGTLVKLWQCGAPQRSSVTADSATSHVA